MNKFEKYIPKSLLEAAQNVMAPKEISEAEQIDELSKDTLKSYQAKATGSKVFTQTKRGRKSAKDQKTIAKRTSGLEKVKAKLEAIHKKEMEATNKHLGKLHDDLHNHFHKEAPKILAKHGYSKVADTEHRTTYVKPHDSGHISTVSISKKNKGTYSYGPEYHLAATTHSYGQQNAHTGIYDEKDHANHKSTMMPKFEANVIQNHERIQHNS